MPAPGFRRFQEWHAGLLSGSWLVPRAHARRGGLQERDWHQRFSWRHLCRLCQVCFSPCLRGFLCRAVGAFLCLECPTVNALLVSDPCVSMLPAPLERAWTCTHVAVHITLGALPRHVPRRVWVDYGRRTHNTYRITSVCDGYVAGVCYEVVMSLSKKMHNL